MRNVDIQSFVQAVEDRKRALGITDEMVLRARNSGQRRTPEKRDALARVQERARKQGLEPMAANF
jgi:hypothetical protein